MADNKRRGRFGRGGGDASSRSIFDLFDGPQDRDDRSFGKVPVVRDDSELDLSDIEMGDARRAAEAEAAGLRHWTEPATGMMPSVLGDDARMDEVRGPSWQGEEPNWVGPDLSDVFSEGDGVGQSRMRRPDRPGQGRSRAGAAAELRTGRADPAPAGRPLSTEVPPPAGRSVPAPAPVARPPVADEPIRRPGVLAGNPTGQVPRTGTNPAQPGAVDLRADDDRERPAVMPPFGRPDQSVPPGPDADINATRQLPVRPGPIPDTTPPVPGHGRPDANLGRPPAPERATGHLAPPPGRPGGLQGLQGSGPTPREGGLLGDGPLSVDEALEDMGFDAGDYSGDHYRGNDEGADRYADYDLGFDDSDENPVRGLLLRTLVGVVMAALVSTVLFFGPLPAVTLIGVVTLLATMEVFNGMRVARLRPATLLGLVGAVALPAAAFVRGESAYPLIVGLAVVFGMLWYLTGADTERPVLNLGLTMIGVLWIGGLAGFGALMLKGEDGTGLLATTIIVASASDSLAYLGGRAYGTRPFHHASPNKTWEGTLTGFFGALFAGLVIGVTDVFGVFDGGFVSVMVLAAAVGVLAPIGDLAESLVKRDLGLKDMGTLLPGHGGVLDRVDGLLFALPGAYYVAVIMQLI